MKNSIILLLSKLWKELAKKILLPLFHFDTKGSDGYFMFKSNKAEKAKELWEGIHLVQANNWLTRSFFGSFCAQLDEGVYVPVWNREMIEIVEEYEQSGLDLKEFQKTLLRRRGKKLPFGIKKTALKTLSEGKGVIDEWIVAKKIYPARSVLVFKKSKWLLLLQDGKYHEGPAKIEEKRKFALWRQANNSLRAIFNKETPLGLLPPTIEVSDHEALVLMPSLKVRREAYKGRGPSKIVQGFIPLFKGLETLQKWGSTHLSIDINRMVVVEGNPLIFQLMPQDGMFNLPSKLDVNDPRFEKIRLILLTKLETSYLIDPSITPIGERETLENQWIDLIEAIKSPPYTDMKLKLEELKGTIKRIQNFQIAIAFFEALTGAPIEECLSSISPEGIHRGEIKWENLQRAVYNLSTLSTDSAASIVEWLGKLMIRDKRFTLTLSEASAFLEKIRGDKA